MRIKLFTAILVALLAAGRAEAWPWSGDTSATSADTASGSWDSSSPDKCKEQPSDYIQAMMKKDRFGTLYIARELHCNLKRTSLLGAPLIMTTFVDLSDFSKSSVFGRVMAERLINELSKEGFKVLEIRRAQDIFMKKGVGEVILTNEVAELAAGNIHPRTVLAGTYVATDEKVIINVRIIDTYSPQVFSTASFELDMTQELEDMLRGISPF